MIGWLTSQATYTAFWLAVKKRVVYPSNTRHQPMYTEYTSKRYSYMEIFHHTFG